MTSHDSDLPGHAGAVAHAEEPLGPIDLVKWGAGVLGIVAGLLIAVCFMWATSVAA